MVPGAFDHRVRLPGQRRLGYEGHALRHRPVHRDAVPRRHKDLVARRDLVHRHRLAFPAASHPLAGVERCAQPQDRVAQRIPPPPRQQGAERVDGYQHGHNLVVDVAASGEGAVHRSGESADHAGEKKLLEDDAPAPGCSPRFAQDGQAGQQEHADRRERQRPVDDPARRAGDGRQVHREGEDHRLPGQQSRQPESQPLARVAGRHVPVLGTDFAGVLVAAGGHEPDI